jgi:hypothetical protein
MLLTQLRVLRHYETIQGTSSDRIQKKDAVMRYFHGSTVATIEMGAFQPDETKFPQKAWDWAGIVIYIE